MTGGPSRRLGLGLLGAVREGDVSRGTSPRGSLRQGGRSGEPTGTRPSRCRPRPDPAGSTPASGSGWIEVRDRSWRAFHVKRSCKRSCLRPRRGARVRSPGPVRDGPTIHRLDELTTFGEVFHVERSPTRRTTGRRASAPPRRTAVTRLPPASERATSRSLGLDPGARTEPIDCLGAPRPDAQHPLRKQPTTQHACTAAADHPARLHGGGRRPSTPARRPRGSSRSVRSWPPNADDAPSSARCGRRRTPWRRTSTLSMRPRRSTPTDPPRTPRRSRPAPVPSRCSERTSAEGPARPATEGRQPIQPFWSPPAAVPSPPGSTST